MKHPDFIFDTHRASDCPNRFCRVHYFFHFTHDQHEPFPYTWSIFRSRHGWLAMQVFCGPGAWFPKRPDYRELTDMRRTCPHDQLDLTCNYCLRHMFRPYEV